ncbi:sigma-54-dependent transcriptional regulator [Albibacterium bauzanense]|uniref:Two-component system response regulator HydG n=1 Tax=Albibacterium bauzanense TaxID=653929 RepID=A0A4R1M084_9SPHI|nr:sigma-54 dependent transcriptional regulator [Albibacterium bauzanense]TCK85286.1 two-component system response regulator HydG [Albibacterium bauzanense]
MINVLLVEDDTTFSAIIESFLKKNGYQVDPYFSISNSINAIKKNKYDLVLLDYRLGDGNGLEVLDFIQHHGLVVPVIIMTGFSDVRTAVRAMRKGVYDYITKPVNQDELLMILKEALTNSTEKPNIVSKLKLKEEDNSDEKEYVKGKSKIANKLQEYIDLVAPTDMTVLIRGESGTGKEYVAKSIHEKSKRAGKPFVSIDCGTLSKELAGSELFGHIKGSFTGAVVDKRGQFEEASGGTLFLDEIGNLSYEVQVKLLRALQERIIQPIGANKQIKVDVRVIAATNDDLLGSSAGGDFREDLYHRINEFEIHVPPLRERGNDLNLFVDFFMKKANEELERDVKQLDEEVIAVFESYEWPGNLRELKNVVKRMVLLTQGDTVQVSALPEDMVQSLKNNINSYDISGDDLKSKSEAHERQLIIEVLQKVKYNKSKAAQLLNIDRKTLYNKLDKYQIS